MTIPKGYAAARQHPLRTAGLILFALMLSMTAFFVSRSDTQATLASPYVNIVNGKERFVSGAVADWANSGTTYNTACTNTITGTAGIHAIGTNGLFDCGKFLGNTTTPAEPNFVGDGVIVAKAFIVDPLKSDTTACPNATGAGDSTAYTGGATKNGAGFGAMLFTNGSLQPKDDLSNIAAAQAGSASQYNGGVADATHSGRFELYFMGERIVNNGASHIDMEFTQSHVGLVFDSPTSCQGHFSGDREQGDILLAIDYSNGGGRPTPTFWEWLCTAPAGVTTNTAPIAFVNTGLGTICNNDGGPHIQDVIGSDAKFGAPAYYLVSTSDVSISGNCTSAPGTSCPANVPPTACGGWACRDSNGAQVTSLLENDFFEGGIDLGHLGFTGCLASVIPHTRASPSASSTLSDFAGPRNFGNCSTTVQTQVTHPGGASFSCPATPGASGGDTIEVGTTVTDRACVYGQAGQTLGGTVRFRVFSDTTCLTLATTPTQVSANDSGNLAVSGTPATATFSFTVNASATYYVGVDYSGAGANTPSSSVCTAEPVIVVNARIDLSPLTDTNKVNDPHLITCTITQNDGLVGGATGGDAATGFGPAPDGTVCTVSLPTNNASAVFVPAIGGNTCTTGSGTGATGPGTGACTVTINTSSAGLVVIHATTTFAVGGVSLTRATNSTGNGDDVQKVYVNARIAVSPLTATNAVDQAHTITCTITQDDGLNNGVTGGDATTGFGPAPNGTTCTLSLLNNNASAAFVGGVNTCTTSGGLGTCTVQINTSKSGSVDIHATTTFLVGGVSVTRATNSTGNSNDANKVYIDAGINITPLSAVNLVGNPHTFTATLRTTNDDGANFTNAPDGITITFSLTPGAQDPNASFVGGVSTCTTGTPTPGSGACSVSVTGTAPGTVTINACANGFTLSGVGGSFTRCTGDTATHKFDGPPATKTFVQPATTLKVTDTLTGLPLGAVGNVVYAFYTSLADCTAGTGGVLNGGGGVTSATPTSTPVVPDSTTQTISNGSLFFSATFVGTGGTTPTGSFTTDCHKETAAVTA